MAFIDSLDNKGKQLYIEYIKSRNKWIDYIRPKAHKKFIDYLNSNNKHFDQYEYMNKHLSDAINQFTKHKHTPSKENTAKYKKLSLLFHPDKFNYKSSLSADLFVLINKFYSDNNDILINTIDTISHLILDTELNCLDNCLKNIITNLNNPEITNILKKEKDVNKIFTMLSSNTLIINNISIETDTTDTETTDTLPVDNDKYEEFTNSIYYLFYKDNKTIIDYINDKFITEAELIDKIEQTGKYNNEFITYCAECYKDNKQRYIDPIIMYCLLN